MKLVLFDCDGTLVDGQFMILKAMREACLQTDTTYVGDEAVRQIVGLSLPKALEVLFSDYGDETRSEIHHYFTAHFAELRALGQDHEPLFPFIKDVVKGLHGQGYVLGVATGKSRRGLDITLANHELSDYFTTLHCADDGPSKPHPDMIHQAMKNTGFDPHETYMIGDTIYDIQMAHAAGVKAIGVSWGYHTQDQLRQVNAHHIIEDIRRLPGLVQN